MSKADETVFDVVDRQDRKRAIELVREQERSANKLAEHADKCRAFFSHPDRCAYELDAAAWRWVLTVAETAAKRERA